jgi:hypothetical protein
MTFQQFAADIRDSAEYRETVRQRAFSGQLPPDVEVYLLEMADGRTPVSADRVGEPVRQGPTLALIRPSARNPEVKS